MPMQPRFEVLYGISTYTDREGNTSETRRPREYNILDSINSVTGDFKHPRPQAFRKYQDLAYKGMIRETFRDGSSAILTGIIPGYPSADPDFSWDTTQVFNDCAGKLYDQVRGGLNLAVDLAEAGQAKSMISNSLKGLQQLVFTLKDIRGLAKGLKALPKPRLPTPQELANKWLEFTYGWKPLASSIYDCGIQLHKELLSPKPTNPQRFKARATHTTRRTQSINVAPGVDVSRQTDTSVRCEMVAFYRASSGVNQTLAGFTSLNPAAVAWELVPYSFVVDWVLDVGGYLQNLESAVLYGSNFVDGYVTITGQSAASAHLYGHDNSAPDRSIYYNATCSAFVKRKNRDLLTETPYPYPPKVQLDLGWQRLVSAASLLTQLISSTPPHR